MGNGDVSFQYPHSTVSPAEPFYIILIVHGSLKQAAERPVSSRPRKALGRSAPIPGRMWGFQAKEDISSGLGDISGHRIEGQ